MNDYKVGDLLAGKYEIKQVLGSGGMGKVYRARQVDLGRDVALKIPSLVVLQSPEILARFSREARTVARLIHENIVQVYEFVQSDEATFISMEFVEGQDLKELISNPPPGLTIGDIVKIIEGICDGLGHAHDFGIVHRDVKPHNVMVCRLPKGRWRVKIMDFGIAHVDQEAQFTQVDGGAQLTQTGQALGTPSYMAPEQIRGEGISHLSDIYSLGCVLYYIFTKSTVFSGSGLTVAVAHLNEAPPSLRTQNPSLPPALDDLIQACLSKDPAGRPKNAHEVGERTRAALTGRTEDPLATIWAQTQRISGMMSTHKPTEVSPTGGGSVMEIGTQQTIAYTGTVNEAFERRRASGTQQAPLKADDPTMVTGGVQTETTPTPPLPVTPPKKSSAGLMIGLLLLLVFLGSVAAAVLLLSKYKDQRQPIPSNGGGTTTGVTGTNGGETGGNDGAVGALQPTPAVSPTPEPTDAGPTPVPTEPPPPTATPRPPELAQLERHRATLESLNSLDQLAGLYNSVLALVQSLPAENEHRSDAIALLNEVGWKVVYNPPMVSVRENSFTMGVAGPSTGNGPAHRVELSAYSIGRYEVTALEYATFLNDPDVDAAAYAPMVGNYGTDTQLNVVRDEKLERWVPAAGRTLHPANGISWNAAQAYIAWLSQETNRAYRLPTEAEWERAAAGTSAFPYPWGANDPDPSRVQFNASGTTEVIANANGASSEGIYHLSGNVWEWVGDWYSADTYSERIKGNQAVLNPTGPVEGTQRVYRGGSFNTTSSSIAELQATYRWREDPAVTDTDIGFRLATSQ